MGDIDGTIKNAVKRTAIVMGITFLLMIIVSLIVFMVLV
jgi:hypothetical protein